MKSARTIGVDHDRSQFVVQPGRNTCRQINLSTGKQFGTTFHQHLSQGNISLIQPSNVEGCGPVAELSRPGMGWDLPSGHAVEAYHHGSGGKVTEPLTPFGDQNRDCAGKTSRGEPVDKEQHCPNGCMADTNRSPVGSDDTGSGCSVSRCPAATVDLEQNRVTEQDQKRR